VKLKNAGGYERANYMNDEEKAPLYQRTKEPCCDEKQVGGKTIQTTIENSGDDAHNDDDGCARNLSRCARCIELVSGER
jgi:hypothetical protein